MAAVAGHGAYGETQSRRTRRVLCVCGWEGPWRVGQSAMVDKDYRTHLRQVRLLLAA